jgi:hypothetical protein
MRARLLSLGIAAAAVAAGCGGGSHSTTSSTPARGPVQTQIQAALSGPKLAAGSPLGRVAVAAAAISDPNDCPRFYAPGNGVSVCVHYITSGTRHAGAQPVSYTRARDRAVVDMRKPGDDVFALLMVRRAGRWKVYDGGNFLPAAGG